MRVENDLWGCVFVPAGPNVIRICVPCMDHVAILSLGCFQSEHPVAESPLNIVLFFIFKNAPEQLEKNNQKNILNIKQ